MFPNSFARCAALLLIAASPMAPSKECTQEEVRLADRQDAVIPAKNWTWERLYESFRRFGNCSDAKNPGIWDAELATTYDGAVQHLLIDDWQHVSEFGKLIQKHPSFERFVLSHVNEAFPLDGGKAVMANARDHCPESYGGLCKEIERAASPMPDSEKKGP